MEDLVKELTIDMIPDGDNRIIAETIGVENYYKLCSVVGGSTIYLQKPESVLRPVRDAHIKAEFNGCLLYTSTSRTSRPPTPPPWKRMRAIPRRRCSPPP